MAKIFRDSYSPIEIELENNNGEIVKIQSRFVASKDAIEIEKLTKDFNDKKLEMTLTEFIIKTMIVRFGNDTDFWTQFSTDMLQSVAEYYVDESKKKPQIKTG